MLKYLFLALLLPFSLGTFASQVEDQDFALDLDDDGRVEALSDGLLAIRYLFGFTGDSLVVGAIGVGAMRTEGAEVYAYAEANRADMDLDLDGEVNALTDGLILIRYLFGFRGDSLTENALAVDASRTSAAEIVTSLDLQIDRDGDNVINSRDFFPDDPGEWFDTDLDGLGNNSDDDDDGDGVIDSVDAFPLDRNEALDSDQDGIGNNADLDDDNDGVEDSADWAPLDSSESRDSDSDGLGDNFDPDDDNDFIPDSLDLDPLDANLSRSTRFDFRGTSSLGLSTELVEVKQAGDGTFFKQRASSEKFGLTSDNISNVVSFDDDGNLVESPISSSATLFAAEAQLSPDKKFLYLLTSAHIQGAIEGLDDEECSIYRIRLEDQTFRCLLLTQDGDIEPSLLIPNYRSDYGRGAMDFRADGAAVMQGFNWNRVLPANVSSGTNSTQAWFMSSSGDLTPLRTDDYHYVTGAAWINDDYFVSLEQPVTIDGGFAPDGRLVIWAAESLEVIKILDNSEDLSGMPVLQGMSKESKKVHVAHLEIDPISLTAKPSPRDSYVIVSSDRQLVLQFGSTSCGSQASKWFIDDIPFDGPEQGVWIELSECETDINALKYDKQSGSGTDIKYRALAFSGDYILHRKVMRSAYTLVSIDGQAYDWEDTYQSNVEIQLRNNLGSLSIRYQDPAPQGLEFSPSDELLQTARTAFQNGEDDGVDLVLVYEDADGGLTERVIYLRYFDLKDMEDGETRFLNAPLSAIEGFCLIDIVSSENKCSRLDGYDVRVEDNRGGGAPGVRTQAIIEDKIYVWFKDSTDLVYYEASALIADFMERGDEALTINLSNIGGGDATAISQALFFDFDGFLGFAGISVNRLRDSQASARIQIEFGERLSGVVGLPQVSLLGAATELEVSATEYSANEERDTILLGFPADQLRDDQDFELSFPEGFFLRDDNRRFQPDEVLTLRLCVLDYDCDEVEDGDDAFPEDPTESADSDSDGVGDNADVFPNDPDETADFDGDGIGDNGDDDDDGDGVSDSEDAFPLDSAESLDTDQDGVGNNADSDDDGDGRADDFDAFPLDGSEVDDTDGDGVGNNADEDDDGDGVRDEEDAFPLDPEETHDTDGDGIGDNADEDSPVAISRALIEFGVGHVVIPENMGTALVQVNRMFSDQGEVSVSYESTSFSAVSGKHYEPVSGTLTWPDGDLSHKLIEVPIMDNTERGTENFLKLGLKLHSSDEADLGKSETLISIQEDDLADLPDESHGAIQALGYGVKGEEGEILEIPFIRFGGAYGEAVVDFDYGYVGSFPTIEDGRSNQITLIDSSLRWADGESGIQYLKVEAPQDPDSENNQYFFLRGRYQVSIEGQLQEISTGTVLTIVDDDPTPAGGRIIPHDRATRVAEGATRSIGFSRVGGSKGVRGLKLNEPIGTSSLTDEDYLFAGTQLEWEDGQTGSLSIDFTATQNSEHEEGKALFYNVTFDEDQTSDYRLRVYLYEDDPSTTDSDEDGFLDIVDADLDDDGVVNWFDRFPNDSSEYRDTDGDGVGDNADAFPDNRDESKDSDNDGVGDNADNDDDNDGVDDSDDAYPLDPSRSEEGSDPVTSDRVAVPQSLVEFSVGHVSVDEGRDSRLHIPVHRLFNADSTLKVSYRTLPVNTEAGVDFTDLSGTLEWGDGEDGVRHIEVDIFDNADSDSTEFRYFKLQLYDLEAEEGVLGRDEILVGIRDNERFDRPSDYPGKIVPLFSDFRINEGGTATVEFQRVDGDVGEITLNLGFRFDDLSYLKEPPKENPYELSSSQLTWTDRDTSVKSVSFTVPEEGRLNGLAQYNLVGEYRRPDGVVVSHSLVIDVISNELVNGEQFFLPTHVFAISVESEAEVGFSYTRLGAVEDPASIVINPSGYTATEGDDFVNEGALSLDWASGEAGTKRVSVQVIDDEQPEPFELVVGQVAGENPSIRLSVIVDDDPSGDFDGDGYRDHSDLDDDDDGYVDEIDRFPLDASEYRDSDGDGVGDGADSDDDADGIVDEADNCPVTPNPQQEDFDGDGVGDICDLEGKLAWNVDDIESVTLEVSNVDDLLTVLKVTAQGEEVLGEFGEGSVDLLPRIEDGENVIRLRLENTGSGWTYGWKLRLDGDVVAEDSCGQKGTMGCRNNDNQRGVVYEATLGLYRNDGDQDGVVDSQDAFPTDPTEQQDSDGDGIGDNADQDADGNGAVDVGETEAGSEEYQLAVARDAFVNLRSASTYADVGDQSVVIFVERSGDSTEALSVPYQTIDGAAIAGIDYEGRSDTLNWAAGDSDAKSITINLKQGFEHGIKEFYLELEDGANYTVGFHRAHIGIVGVPTQNSDWGGFIQFVDYGQIVFEGSSDNEIRVARFGGSKGSVEVQYLVQGPQTFSGALRWGDGDLEPKYISIDVPDDESPSSGLVSYIVTLSDIVSDDGAALYGAPIPIPGRTLNNRLTVIDNDGYTEFLASPVPLRNYVNVDQSSYELRFLRFDSGRGDVTLRVDARSLSSDGTYEDQFEVSWTDGDTSVKSVSVPTMEGSLQFSTQVGGAFLAVRDFEASNLQRANSDADGDGISDLEDWDFDNDGLPDYLDLDADGDGVPNGEDPEPLNPSA